MFGKKKGDKKLDLSPEGVEFRRQRKTYLTIIFILIGIILYLYVPDVIQGWISQPDYIEVKNSSGNYTIEVEETDSELTNNVLTVINSFFKNIFESPYGFWTNFFIFLGVVYVLQTAFGITHDIIRIVLIAFVGLIKLIKFLMGLIFRR